METDIVKIVGAVARKVRSRNYEGQPAKVVLATRTYNAEIADVWDALTNVERIPRWFLPISGELKLGGYYQLEGNASGEVTSCDPPNSFGVTWEFGSEVTWLNIKLTDEGEMTGFQLEHIAHVTDERWAEFGPGAVGVGWDMGLMGLEQHLVTGASVDPAQMQGWIASDAGKQFVRASSYSWCAAAIGSGDTPKAAN